MQPNPQSAHPAPSPRRSVLVTVLAWVAIVISGLLVPISVISLAMILVRSYGTENVEPLGFLLVVVAPPATVVGGIGLLMRRAWARYYMIGLLWLLIVLNGWDLLTAKPETTTYTSESGVKTTQVTSYGSDCHQIPIILISLGMLVVLFQRSVREEFAGRSGGIAPAGREPIAPLPLPNTTPSQQPAPLDQGRDWRVGHQGRDRMYYEESVQGTWQRIDIDGEMLTGRAHHVIYFASPEAWQQYPEWARFRREEIIGRIKSEFRPPEYEYQGDAAGQRAMPTGQPAIPPPRPATGKTHPITAQQRSTVILVVIILLAITAGMSWLVASGVSSGSTYFPSKRATQQRTVEREQEPATFWLSIGVYSAVGLGTGWMALWLIRQGRRGKP